MTHISFPVPKNVYDVVVSGMSITNLFSLCSNICAGFSAHLKHFSFLGSTKMRPLPTFPFFTLPSVFVWPKSEKCFEHAEEPTEMLHRLQSVWCDCLGVASHYNLQAGFSIIFPSTFTFLYAGISVTLSSFVALTCVSQP